MEHGVGEVLQGRYELLAVMARGPHTVTYAARDRNGGRLVAIRQWPAGDDEPVAAAELERALAIGKRFTHVHLPRCFDHFALEQSQGVARYLVREGGDARMLPGQIADEDELRAIALALLRLLDAMHKQQLVHGAVRASELVRRPDGRLYLHGTASESAARGGVTGDLRALGETLLSVRLGHVVESASAMNMLHTLPRSLQRWVERLLASGAPHGFANAGDALQALQGLERSSQRKPWLWLALALAAVAATATSFFVMKRIERVLRPRSAAALGKPIGDTRFAPKADSAKPALRLEYLRSMAGHWSVIMELAFDARGERIASASYDGSARLWNTSDGAALMSFGHGGKVGGVGFAALPAGDGQSVERVLTGGGTTLRVWDAQSGQQLRSFDVDHQQVTKVHAARDGRFLLAAGFEGAVRIFDSASGELVRSIQTPGRVYALAVDPAGTMVAAAGIDGVVRLFRFDDGALLHELRGHGKTVNALAFAADGNTLASASDDHTVRIWYAPAGKLMRTLEGHRDEVWALAFDPGGKQLASGSKDGELRIWDPFSGELVLARKADRRGVAALAFSPDGQRLAIGGGEQRVDLYALVKQLPSWRPPAVTAPVKKSPPPEPPKGASPALVLVYRARALVDTSEGHKGLSEALDLLQQALKQDPRLVDAYVERARVEYKAGYMYGEEYEPAALDRARADLKRALALDPDAFNAHLRTGYVNMFAKDYPAAEEAALRCEQLRPGDPETQVLFMELAMRRDQPEQVVLHARSLIEGSPTRNQLFTAYGLLREVYEQRREYDAAEEMYRSVVNLEPESAWTKGNFASYLVRRERYDEAATWARAAIAQMDYRAAHIALGDAYAGKAEVALAQNQKAECERWLGLAFEADPRSADGHYVRALMLRKEHDEDGAQRELQAALASDPEHRRAADALKK